MKWEFPKIGGTIYILGGGPSINNLNLEKLKGKNVIGTNDAYVIASFIPYLYFMDCPWYIQHRDALDHYDGVKISTCVKCANAYDVVYLKTGSPRGIDDRKGYLCRGNNSGYGAINVAVKFSPSKIILLGYDMRFVDGRANFHNNHTREVKEERYTEEFYKTYEYLKEPLSAKGIEIFNATPNSKLQTFPVISPDEVLKGLLK